MIRFSVAVNSPCVSNKSLTLDPPKYEFVRCEIKGACITIRQFPLSSSILLFVMLAKLTQLSTYSSKDLTSGGNDDILGRILSIGKKTDLTALHIFSLINLRA